MVRIGTIVAITGTTENPPPHLCSPWRASGYPTFVGGNLGDPLGDAVGTRAAAPGGILIVEVSSFQLETVDSFHPRIAALLNVTPDHLDRYRDFAEYADTKARIFARQGASDFADSTGHSVFPP